MVGRPIGSAEGVGYSETIAAMEGAWDAAALDAYLADPRGWAPGTSKTFAGLRDPEARAAVILYLNASGPAPLPIAELVRSEPG